MGDASEDLFFVRSQAALAKATFSNLDLIVQLERGLVGHRADEHVKKQVQSGERRAEIANAHVTGRFLRFRKLHPSLTDEALEHRIAWSLGRASKEGSERSRNVFDDPAQCIVPLLARLGEIFLCEARDGSLRVRSRYLAEWQDLILVVPPMLISAVWMSARKDQPDETISGRKLFHQRVQNWLCNSTLPVDDNPLLDQLCKVEGLDETHMHLNGTTEAEKVWMDALRKTSEVVGAVSGIRMHEGGIHAKIGNGVNRLLRQEDPVLSPQRLRARVEHAVVLKSFLLRLCTASEVLIPIKDSNPNEEYAAAVRSRPGETGISATTAEALQLVDIILYLSQSRAGNVSGMAFHWYSILRAQFCRLLVQQTENTGFDQFQYITFNELRETTEKDFSERFRQIERGLQQPVDFLEARFAPKTTPDGNANRLMQIFRGYLQFLDEEPDGRARGQLARIFSDSGLRNVSLSETLKLVRSFEDGEIEGDRQVLARSKRRLRLGLVAHFIKQTNQAEREGFLAGGGLAPSCRDSKTRREIDQAARALLALINRTTGLSDMIRGVDAASNERHSGPEVFSPVFRRMRRAGIQRFTYHVGEDFVHIASGLRAMNEAVRYLNLSAGCRIGHGTAAGLTPVKWWSSVGGTVIQPREDRLDDLVFAWGILVETGSLLDRLPLLDLEIRRLAMQIWQDPALTPDLLLRAWQLRHLDPDVRSYGNYDVDQHCNSEIRMFKESQHREPDAHAQFLRRHGVGMSKGVFQRSSEHIVVSREKDVLDLELLAALQAATLKMLQENHIAIETLPSSNVRISIHQSYEEHHSVGWLGFGRDFCPTSVVVGSDDPGIFATSLRTEYAHLLRALEANGAGSEASVILERVNKTSKRFRF